MSLLPPLFYPESPYITLALYYGGTFQHSPNPCYNNGKVKKLDYVNIKTLGKTTLHFMVRKFLQIPNKCRFYVFTSTGFKLLSNDDEYKSAALPYKKEDSEFPIYVEPISMEGRNNDGEIDELCNDNVDIGLDNVGIDDSLYPESDAEDDDFVADVDHTYEADDVDDQLFNDAISSDAEFNTLGDAVVEDSEEISEAESEPDMVGSEDDDCFDRYVLSEDDNDEIDRLPLFNEINIYDPVFRLGMTLRTKEIFKTAVDSHAIITRRSFHYMKSDSTRVYVRCDDETCDWKMNCVLVGKSWVLREYDPIHTCYETFQVRNVSTKWLAGRYLHLFKINPKRCVKTWRDDVSAELNVIISKDQAYRARNLALDMLRGEPDSQYSKLWDYVEELRRSNPGSTIVLGTENDDGDQRFSRFYVCFSALKMGFKAACRPCVGVDGCHLKGPHGGILLTAVGCDPNNGGLQLRERKRLHTLTLHDLR